MKKSWLYLACMLVPHTLMAAPLSAIMTFESMTLTTDGVTKQTRFQEIFIRDDNTVWSERVIPTQAFHHEHYKDQEPNQEHEHNVNFATAGKWLIRDENNRVTFSFVRKNEKKIITPRASEYGTLGFDGNWETAFYLVNRDALKTMKPVKKPAPDGAQWLEKKDGHYFTRILWSQLKDIPLRIETGSLDGTSQNIITVSFTPMPATLPWRALTDYQTIAYEDLLD